METTLKGKNLRLEWGGGLGGTNKCKIKRRLDEIFVYIQKLFGGFASEKFHNICNDFIKTSISVLYFLFIYLSITNKCKFFLAKYS